MSSAGSRRFEVPSPGKLPMAVMLGAGLIVPGGVMVAAVAKGGHLPTGAALAAGAALAIVFALFSAMLRRRSVTLEGGEALVIRGAIYTRRVPLASLDIDGARILSLDEHREDRPFWRLNGIGLPGYRVGHYRTWSKKRAFCLLTDFTRVLRLKESSGSLLLISLDRPRDLLKALQDRDNDRTA
ncbi:MAG: hypothetical protein R3F22_00785 [Lysobacteraceae bacterium]